MRTIIHKISAGDKLGQEDREKKIVQAEEYIKMLEKDGEELVSKEEFDDYIKIVIK